MSTQKEYETQRGTIEGDFGNFIETIPGWRDLLGSILVSTGLDLPEDIEDLGQALIPVVKDVFYEENIDRISFEIRVVSSSWVHRYIKVGPFPFEWLTSPETAPIDYDYLRGKLERREEYLKDLESKRTYTEGKISSLLMEIKRIKKVLGEE